MKSMSRQRSRALFFFLEVFHVRPLIEVDIYRPQVKWKIRKSTNNLFPQLTFAEACHYVSK